jgi:REP element-mobilizing transposase RayT
MQNLDLRSYGSSVGLIVGHLGFCPKYRKELFAREDIKERFIELCHDVERRHYEKYRIRIHELVGGR